MQLDKRAETHAETELPEIQMLRRQPEKFQVFKSKMEIKHVCFYITLQVIQMHSQD